MLDRIKVTFPQTQANACIETLTEAEFCIYDTDAKRCSIQNDPDGVKHFTVENPASRPIHFLAIDKCLFADSDSILRCDCAVFDSKTFCFVEIKQVDHAARRADQYRKAKEQLRVTIQYFQEQLAFSSKRIEAYACVGRTTARPARQATDLNEQFEFSELGAVLYHGNVKRFGP